MFVLECQTLEMEAICFSDMSIANHTPVDSGVVFQNTLIPTIILCYREVFQILLKLKIHLMRAEVQRHMKNTFQYSIIYSYHKQSSLALLLAITISEIYIYVQQNRLLLIVLYTLQLGRYTWSHNMCYVNIRFH